MSRIILTFNEVDGCVAAALLDEPTHFLNLSLSTAYEPVQERRIPRQKLGKGIASPKCD